MRVIRFVLQIPDILTLLCGVFMLRPLVLPCPGLTPLPAAEPATQCEEGGDLLGAPMHPTPLHACLHHQLARTLHDPAPDGIPCREEGGIVVPELLMYLRSGFDGASDQSFMELFEGVKRCDFLVLDDWGAHSATAWANEQLWMLLNHRNLVKAPTIITTNYGIDQFDPRLRSRFAQQPNMFRKITT
jgi:hypothetical protein